MRSAKYVKEKYVLVFKMLFILCENCFPVFHIHLCDLFHNY